MHKTTRRFNKIVIEEFENENVKIIKFLDGTTEMELKTAWAKETWLKLCKPIRRKVNG